MSARLAALATLFDGWAAGDWSAGADLFDENLSFVTFNPDSDQIRAKGVAGVAAWLREFFLHWEDFRAVAERMEEHGDVVIVDVRQSGRGRTSGAHTEMPICALFRFEGDRVVELLWMRDREHAYSVAGLGKPP